MTNLVFVCAATTEIDRIVCVSHLSSQASRNVGTERSGFGTYLSWESPCVSSASAFCADAISRVRFERDCAWFPFPTSQLHDAVRAKEQKDKEKEEKKAKGGFFGFGRTHKEHKDKHKPVQIVDATPAHPPATATHTPAPILTPTPASFGTPPALTPIPSFVPTPAFSPSPNNSNSSSNSSNGNNNSSSIANSGKVERPDSLLASWQMSDELMQEMMTWQKQKENYERDVAPLLQAVCSVCVYVCVFCVHVCHVCTQRQRMHVIEY